MKENLTKGYNAVSMLKRLKDEPLHHINLEKALIKMPMEDGHNKEAVTIIFNEDTVTLSGDKTDADKAVAKARKVFNWKRDLFDIHNHFKQTDLNPLFEQFQGTPLVTEFTPYGCLIKTIIHQQLNMAFAYTLSTRFVQTFGEKHGDVWFYPEPHITASLEPKDLRELQFSGRKAEYVIDTSRKIVDGELNLDTFSEKTDEEIIRTLTSIRGIGPWTAECFLLFGLGRENLMPAGDIGIQNGLKVLLNIDQKPTKDEIYDLADQWKPYNSYAALYLWLSTEQNR
ncbi:DNA-3-methyladenine glycosylase family protein [Alteribacillus sp. HJP-4]